MTDRRRLAERVRERIAGQKSGRSAAAWARRRRWNLLLERFPAFARSSVIDLGGTPGFWATAPVRPERLTIVNVSTNSNDGAPWAEVIAGDACEAAELVSGRTFDLVFSNSTIEHVGGHDRCQAFARSVLRLAPTHWIQTPYRYFPIEPHFVFPGFQFLPVPLRARVAARWPLSYTRSVGGVLDDATGAVLSVELLGRTQLQYYFPDSEIVAETVFGLTKSIIAVAS
jgi:hypothetical protein